MASKDLTLTSDWQQINVLLFLSLLMLLTGCATSPKHPVEYRTMKEKRLSLPAELTNPILVPTSTENLTYGESIEFTVVLYGFIEQCNIDKNAIRQLWFSD